MGTTDDQTRSDQARSQELGSDAFDAPPRGQTFVVDIDGFEGPLDLLLALAREHKLDLAKLSILDLARQYLDFIEQARDLRLEVAADYLVMAAWLAYLKSKLLLPDEQDEGETTGEELAAQLAFQDTYKTTINDKTIFMFSTENDFYEYLNGVRNLKHNL